LDWLSLKLLDKTVLVAGTRGSDLALAQTQIVIDLLRSKYPKLAIEKRIIITSGDELQQRRRNPNLTGKDSFTRQIDLALIRGEVDFAVHSLKDLPVENANGSNEKKLEIAAYPKRESPLDVLIPKKEGMKLETLPQNARIGTSSIRRAIQLKLFRPDFHIVELHGNVTTRIRKLARDEESNLDAIVLAQAGLNRLGIEHQYLSQVLPSSIMLPAIGQGCLAVSVRSNDMKIKNIIRSIDDRKTRLCVSAERAFSKELGEGCNTPIGALATIKGPKITLQGFIGGEARSKKFKSDYVMRDTLVGKAERAKSLGTRLARKLRSMSR
jgi:hydroxymethylbilane synthase